MAGPRHPPMALFPEEYYAHYWPVLEWPFERRVELFYFEKSQLEVSDLYNCLVRNALLIRVQYLFKYTYTAVEMAGEP